MAPDLDALCVQEQFDVVFVEEELVNEHEEAVPLCTVLTLPGATEH